VVPDDIEEDLEIVLEAVGYDKNSFYCPRKGTKRPQKGTVSARLGSLEGNDTRETKRRSVSLCARPYCGLVDQEGEGIIRGEGLRGWSVDAVVLEELADCVPFLGVGATPIGLTIIPNHLHTLREDGVHVFGNELMDVVEGLFEGAHAPLPLS